MEHLRNRLRDLLLLLLEALDTRQDGPVSDPEDVRQLIAAAGYGEQEMQDLLTWLQDRQRSDDTEETWLSARLVARAGHKTLRQMGSREDELLTVPAFGYLLDLVRTSQITAEQMESMIQFAQLVPDGPLTPDDLSMLLDRVVFAERHTGPDRIGHANRVH